MFKDGNLILAIATIGGLVVTILGFAVYALTETVPLEKPFVERRKPIKKAA